MTRDIRDPLELGKELLILALLFQKPLTVAYDTFVYAMDATPDWTGDGFMSSNPAHHHSKVRQDISKSEDFDYAG